MRAAAAFARLGGGTGAVGKGCVVGTADITGLDIFEVEMMTEGLEV